MTDKTLRPQQATVDKTLRPATANADKTLRPQQATVDKTLRPTSANADKTLRPHNLAEKTLRPGGKKAVQQQVIAARQEYELNGKKYEFVKVISDSTGEAEILLVKHNNNEWVLKLYFASIQANHNILGKVKNARGSGLLVDIFEHGKWTNPDNPSEVRDFELMAYGKGGSLEDYWKTAEKNPQVLENIIKKAAFSIDYFHQQNLIHRDIKPANFLFLNEKPDWQSMVLSDFGISIESDSEHKAEPSEQLRTKVYAAPESYALVTDEKGVATAQISDKSDFYSLGMMMLELWIGKEKFSNIREHDLVKMKNYDNLPYPEDMPERLLQLLRALTLFNEKNRAGFAEIEKWIKGENIFNLHSQKIDDNIGDIKIIYNAEKKQVAHSKAELVAFMLADKESAKQYLYRGKIAKWFEDLHFTEVANELELIVENKYPKDQNAGILAACYYLDDDLLYTDIKGKEMTSFEDIAASLIKNRTNYADALANKNDALWLYFKARGGGDIVDKYQKLFSKKKNQNTDSVLALAYEIDGTLPFQITNEDGKIFDCQTVEDVIDVKYNEMFSDESWDALISNSFQTWLLKNNPAIAGKLLSTPGYDTDQWCVLYNLSPKVSFTLQTDETADDYIYDLNAVCSFLDDCMIEYIKGGRDEESFESGILDEVCNIDDDTRLYYYMQSKGWDKQINWIRETMNTNSEENEEKYSINNWWVCFYKTLKGLGYDPSYYFPESNKYIFSLDDLADIPKKEIFYALEEESLSEYLTIFYQEDPYLDLSKKFTFEKETVKYLEKLEELNPKDIWVENFRIGTSEVEGKMKENKRMKTIHLCTKLLLGLLTFALTAFAIYQAIEFVIPTFDPGWWGMIPAIIVAIAVCWYLVDIECWNLFWSIVVAAVGFVIANVICKFAIIYLNFVVAGGLFVWLIFATIKSFGKKPFRKRPSDQVKALDFEGQYLEPLHFAFKAKEGDTFKSSVVGDYNENIYEIKKRLKTFLLWILPLFLASALLLGAMMYLSPKLGTMIQKTNEYEEVVGEYIGTFEGRNATLNITKATAKEVDATITVSYSTQLSETLKGTINLDDNSVHFDDVFDTNGNLDGEYTGVYDPESKTISGTYQNYKTKKQVAFRFQKKN